MRKREVVLLILSVALLSSTLYFVWENTQIKVKKEALQQAFTDYKKSVQKEKTQALQRAKETALQAKKAEREKQILALKEKVETTFTHVQQLEQKYKNKKEKKWIILEVLNQSGLYVKNYSGDSLGDVHVSYLKDGLRAIPLEEIQKVRRRKEGYIKVQDAKSAQVQYLYVKDIPSEHLFIGASLILR